MQPDIQFAMSSPRCATSCAPRWRAPSAPASTPASSCSTPASASARPPQQNLRAHPPARRAARAGPAAPRRRQPQELHRPPRPASRRRGASPAASPPRPGRRGARRRCCASTTSPRPRSSSPSARPSRNAEGSHGVTMQELIRLLTWRDLVDVLLVAVVIYNLLLLIRGTRAVQILLGILFVGVVYYLARLAQLPPSRRSSRTSSSSCRSPSSSSSSTRSGARWPTSAATRSGAAPRPATKVGSLQRRRRSPPPRSPRGASAR